MTQATSAREISQMLVYSLRPTDKQRSFITDNLCFKVKLTEYISKIEKNTVKEVISNIKKIFAYACEVALKKTK